MTHRERVLAALRHERTDRCPMQISFTPEFAERLRGELRLQGRLPHNPHGGGNTYELECALGQDMLLTSVCWANSYYQAEGDYTDDWGVGWRSVPYQTKFGDGRFTEVVVHPLAEDGAMERYQPPDPTRPELYQDAARMIAEYKSEYFIAGATVTTIFETGWALRGLDRLLMDFVERPEMAEAVLDIPFHYHLEAAKRLVEMGVDMIWTGDDVGSQTGMLISPRMWRKYLKPRMAEFFATLKRLNPEVKIAYHSDGVIDPIVGDLVEIGMDILNPLQPNCVDPARLKREYGDRISFWGSIDEQYALPFGTPEDVTREVQERLETVGRDGGLIIGPTHNVQLDTPMENFWAMMKAIKEPRSWN